MYRVMVQWCSLRGAACARHARCADASRSLHVRAPYYVANTQRTECKADRGMGGVSSKPFASQTVRRFSREKAKTQDLK